MADGHEPATTAHRARHEFEADPRSCRTHPARGYHVPVTPTLELAPATPEDILGILALRVAVADALTEHYGNGMWSRGGTVRGVLWDMRRSSVYVVREGERVIASLALGTRKPWAIDPSYFRPFARALYLTSMAVDPAIQRSGIGRQCIDEARRIAREWPADAIRLDAYNAPAGAGGFYAKCGFRETGRVSYRGCPLIYYEMTV